MNRQRGFSLLEVMLAFALLASALGILIAILGGGLGQVRGAADASQATLHAQSLLDELGVLEPIEPGRRQGESDDGRYRWTMEITEAEDPAPVVPVDPDAAPLESAGRQFAGTPLLYRIQLDVAWGEDDYARSLRFATLRARLPQQPVGALP
ncbi:type IV pilus modification PilV family protein [Arenimonas daejeonensis]|uniref:type IV pilus modification PilV family protein n=1 Tax=Arenimonas daejeonensis TaxID=370777 RepID=UPI0011BF7142|nr:prepilin-type N-terminal cleavage/methylation domain-containing protein [Arenimonas daejeonensis]